MWKVSRTSELKLYPASLALALLAFACGVSHSTSTPPPPWEVDNPVRPLPAAPLGIDIDLAKLPDPPTPERVRLGRWLFYDARLSADGTVSCSTCHEPQYAFSQITPVSTGIRGQKGVRKAPSFVNEAVTLYPYFFWDGRAASFEDQALGPIANPVEMGNTHEAMVDTLSRIPGYRPYFMQAFGTEEITKQRVARAISDYERTRMDGNSPWDHWRQNRDQGAVSAEVKKGHELFFGKAKCNQCHLGQNFTDNRFHNLGVGYDPHTHRYKDEGRYAVTKNPADLGAFKTPTLRDVTRHAPYMHDGSVATLRDVMDLYNRGGDRNPHLDPKVGEPLHLDDSEIDALIAFMKALDGTGYEDVPPTRFPQ